MLNVVNQPLQFKVAPGTLWSAFLGVLMVLVCSQNISATEAERLTAEDCAQLTDQAARLACFDQIFSSGQTSPPTATPSDDPQIENEVMEQRPAAAVAPAVPAAPSTAAPPVAESTTQDTSSNRGGLFSRKTKVEISSRIEALRARDKQRMVFLLENGEMWMQTSPRDLPIKEGDALTIKSGLIGGYVLRTEHGVSTRVHRIN